LLNNDGAEIKIPDVISDAIMFKEIEITELLCKHHWEKDNSSSLMTYDAVEKNKTGNRNVP
jgi:hypothetical protein